MLKRIPVLTGVVFGLCFGLFTNGHYGYAQITDAAVFGHVGYSTFQLSQLREFNTNILNALPVEGQMVSDFPGYYTYSGSVQLSLDNIFFGLSLGHSSTGSRISYRDYSGYFRFDQSIRTNFIGVVAGISVWEYRNFSANISIWYLAGFHSLEFDSEYKVPGEIECLNMAFDSFTHGIQPTASIAQKIGRFVGKLEFGYEIQTAGKILLSNDHKAYLMSDAGKEVLFKSSGIRLQTGIGFQLFR